MFLENPINGQTSLGCVEVICGSMFSGKTEELIRRLKRAEIAGQNIMIFKPEIDIRYDEGKVVSHDNNSISSTPVRSSNNILLLSEEAEVIALDSDKVRIEKVYENIDRLKLKNVTVIQGDATNKDWWDKKLSDKILIDAPCSGSGVIRRHPDIKLLRKLKDLSQATSIQTKILENLWSLLKAGGELVYATCSILKDENERQIKTFLNNFKDAKHIDIELPWGEGEIGKQKLPEKNYDGFYYAKLLKK